MKYMLMIYRDEAAFAAGKTSGAHSGAYIAYAEALKGAGARPRPMRPMGARSGSNPIRASAGFCKAEERVLSIRPAEPIRWRAVP